MKEEVKRPEVATLQLGTLDRGSKSCRDDNRHSCAGRSPERVGVGWFSHFSLAFTV